MKPVAVTVYDAPVGPCVGVRAIVGVVTVNVPVAVAPPESVAVTVEVVVPLGTGKVQLKAPDALVDREPEVQLAWLTPSKLRVTVLEDEKPVPATVTTVPWGPVFGVTVMAGVVTEKVPDADCPPTSVAVTTVPLVPGGTRKVQLKAPVASVDSDPDVQLALTIVTLSKTSVGFVAWDTENPVPETVTDAPTGPEVGLTVMWRAVTVNEPVAVGPEASTAVTVVPLVPGGTANVQLNTPFEPGERLPEVQLEMVTPSKVSDESVVELEKPFPATVTDAP